MKLNNSHGIRKFERDLDLHISLHHRYQNTMEWRNNAILTFERDILPLYINDVDNTFVSECFNPDNESILDDNWT